MTTAPMVTSLFPPELCQKLVGASRFLKYPEKRPSISDTFSGAADLPRETVAPSILGRRAGATTPVRGRSVRSIERLTTRSVVGC